MDADIAGLCMTSRPVQLAVISIAGYGLALLTNLLLSNLLGTELFGDYQVAFALLSLLASLSLSGTDMVASRYLPTMRKTVNLEGIRAYCAWNRSRIRFGFSIILAVYAVFLAIALATHLADYKRFEEYHLAFHSIWIAPIAALSLLTDRYLVASGYPRTGSILGSLALHLVLLFCVAAAVYGLRLSVSSSSVMIGILVVSFVFLALLHAVIFRTVEPEIYGAWWTRARGASAEHHRAWSRTSNRMLIMRVNSLMLWHLDLFIVEIASPNEAATSLYAAVLLVVRIMQLIPTTISFMIRPLCGAAADDRSQCPKLQKAINESNAVVLGVCSLLLAGMLIGGHFILNAFGPGFSEATTALAMVAVGAFIEALTRQSLVILQTMGHEQVATRISTVSLVIVLGGGFIATYLFSYNGMAAVTGLVLAGKGLISYAFARRRLPEIRPLSVI